jgi:hypothetical protein
VDDGKIERMGEIFFFSGEKNFKLVGLAGKPPIFVVQSSKFCSVG